MRRRALLGAGVSTALAGCLDVITSGGMDGDIGMSAHSFRPETYEATVGETVTWVNNSSRGHTITALSVPDGAEYFATGGYDTVEAAVDAWYNRDGGRLDMGETFSYTVEVPGEYEYYCIPHAASDMYGTLIVSE